MNTQPQRLQKALANAGLASRRTIESWMLGGRLQVNGEVVLLGHRVVPTDRITLDGKTVDWVAERVATVLMYNKPLGELCSHDDPQGRRTVYDDLPEPPGGKWISIGRLDINSEGLLLLTNDGDIAHGQMHPSQGTLREYLVRLSKPVEEVLVQRLLEGVVLEDGPARFDLCQCHRTGKHPWYRVRVSEGRNRLVRRLWASQDVMVSRLIRVRFGDVALPRALPAGQYQWLSSDLVAQWQAASQRSAGNRRTTDDTTEGFDR